MKKGAKCAIWETTSSQRSKQHAQTRMKTLIVPEYFECKAQFYAFNGSISTGRYPQIPKEPACSINTTNVSDSMKEILVEQERRVVTENVGNTVTLNQRLDEGLCLRRVQRFDRTSNGEQKKSMVSLRLYQSPEIYVCRDCTIWHSDSTMLTNRGSPPSPSVGVDTTGWLSIETAWLPVAQQAKRQCNAHYLGQRPVATRNEWIISGRCGT